MGIAGHGDFGFCAVIFQADPDPFMGEKECRQRAENHQKTACPDHIDTGIFGNLQPGILWLIETEEGKTENPVPFEIKLRMVLPDNKWSAMFSIGGIDM